jgi:thiol-disulfide isomerase/thioredoxin
MRVVNFFRILGLSLSFAAIAGCGFEHGSAVLKIGEIAPSLRTKKLSDVNGDLSRLTSYRYPDERMYKLSIDEALLLKKPVLIEFATPGHCTVCDKQLQMLKSLLDKYGNEVVFIHMDQYMNPQAFNAFKVRGDPWTFLVDSDGIVRFQQPGSMLYGELDLFIKRVLVSGSASAEG